MRVLHHAAPNPVCKCSPLNHVRACSHRCDKASVGNWAIGVPCTKCAESSDGMECADGGDKFLVKAGFFKSNVSWVAVACKGKGKTCAGSGNVSYGVDDGTLASGGCAQGFDGPLCGGCAPGWMMTGPAVCVECDSFNPATKAMQVVASIMLICVMCSFEVVHASKIIAAAASGAQTSKLTRRNSFMDGKLESANKGIVEQLNELKTTAGGPLIRSVLGYAQVCHQWCLYRSRMLRHCVRLPKR